MNIDIKLHKNDLPDDLKLGNVIAVDGEFMGLDVRRDPLCLIIHPELLRRALFHF